MAVELLINESEIRDRLAAMGRQIEDDYRDKPLTIVAVLTGSLIALADLVRQIRIPLRIALVQASSYRGATTTATTLVVNEAFAPDVDGRDVLLLDDILDTGQTLSALVQHIEDRGAASVRTAVLLRKVGRQVVPIEPDYCGFVIPDVFVVGYGLDFNDDYRHLPYVGVLQQQAEEIGRMKLALVTRRYPPLIGGAEKVLSYLAAALAAEGADVTVLTSRMPGLGLPHGKTCRSRPVGSARGRPRGPADGRCGWRPRGCGSGGRGSTCGTSPVVRAKPDRPGVCLDAQARRLCRGRGRAAAGLPGRAAARGRRRDGRYRLAVVGELRPQDRPAMPGRHGLRRDLHGHRGRAETGRALRRTLRRLAGSADRGDPQRRPRPAAPWQRRPDWRAAPRAAFVGRLAPEKGLDTLIDAWPAVRAAYPAARLILIGEGPERPALEPDRPGLWRSDPVRPSRCPASRPTPPRRSATPTCSSSPRARRA